MRSSLSLLSHRSPFSKYFHPFLDIWFSWLNFLAGLPSLIHSQGRKANGSLIKTLGVPSAGLPAPTACTGTEGPWDPAAPASCSIMSLHFQAPDASSKPQSAKRWVNQLSWFQCGQNILNSAPADSTQLRYCLHCCSWAEAHGDLQCYRHVSVGTDRLPCSRTPRATAQIWKCVQEEEITTLYKRGIIMQSVILLILFLSILMQFVSSVFNVLLQHHWQLRDSFSLMCFQSSHPWIRTHQLFFEELVIPFLKH